jgi:hypothetical protein
MLHDAFKVGALVSGRCLATRTRTTRDRLPPNMSGTGVGQSNKQGASCRQANV